MKIYSGFIDCWEELVCCYRSSEKTLKGFKLEEWHLCFKNPSSCSGKGQGQWEWRSGIGLCSQ